MDTGGNDDIAVVERYRGCGLHDCQSTERLRVVRAAIDHVYTLDQMLDLVEHAGDVRNPPESRVLAVVCYRALWELSQEARLPQPIISVAHVEALPLAVGRGRGEARRISAVSSTPTTRTRPRASSRSTIRSSAHRARRCGLASAHRQRHRGWWPSVRSFLLHWP